MMHTHNPPFNPHTRTHIHTHIYNPFGQTADMQMDVSDCWPSSVQCSAAQQAPTRLLVPFANNYWTIQPSYYWAAEQYPDMPTHQGQANHTHTTPLAYHLLLLLLCMHSPERYRPHVIRN